jgi:hypothetical protein
MTTTDALPRFLERVSPPQGARTSTSPKRRLNAVTGELRKQASDDGPWMSALIGVVVVAAVAAAIAFWRRRLRLRAEEREAAERAAAEAAAAAAAAAKEAATPSTLVLNEASLDAKVAEWVAAEAAAAAAAPELARVRAGSTALLTLRSGSTTLRLPVAVAAVDRDGATLASVTDVDASACDADALLVVFESDGGVNAHPVRRVPHSATSHGQLRVTASGPGVAFTAGVRRPMRLDAISVGVDGAEVSVVIVALGVDGATVEGPPALPGTASDLYVRLEDGADLDVVPTLVEAAFLGADGRPGSALRFGAVGPETKARLVERLVLCGVPTP